MTLRVIGVVAVLFVAVLGYVGWRSAQPVPAGPALETPAPEAAQPGADGGAATDAGIVWSAPARWQKQGDRPLRLATYAVPGPGGESNRAECALYYLGPHQGGGVEANVERWLGEFENATPALQSGGEVAGMAVSRLEVSGTYVAHGGPDMGAIGRHADWKLIAAIVEGPAGPVFIKLTGPLRTVDGARKDFEALIGGMKRKPASAP